jgi:uncharacterized protein YdhG (YjbR/CyaY superfamily)
VAVIRKAASAKQTDAAASRIRAYLAAQPPATRRALRQIRAAIRSAVPQAVDAFSYGIPGFRFDERPLVWYAGWANHCSVYPLTAGMRASNAAALASYRTAKGTVRFPLDRPLPLALIKRLAKARAAEIRQRGR